MRGTIRMFDYSKVTNSIFCIKHIDTCIVHVKPIYPTKPIPYHQMIVKRMKTNKVHDGYNIKRLREILGIKQEKIAAELGNTWNQQRISLLEKRETISQELLERVAKALNVKVTTIKTFNDEVIAKLVTILTTEGSLTNIGRDSIKARINPVDKLVELYERIIHEKDGEIAGLRQALRGERPP